MDRLLELLTELQSFNETELGIFTGNNLNVKFSFPNVFLEDLKFLKEHS